MSKCAAKKILKFLHEQPLATLGTVNYLNKPEAALIAFVELDSLEIIFETYNFARKYTNLKQNTKVALVIGFDPKVHTTVQYEGVVKEIPTQQIDLYKNLFLKKDTPCTDGFLNHPSARLFKVAPRWIRYSDYSGVKPEILELSFS